ncbi:hypothetical protein DIPPA_29065 [Diplonema papillatum]|nr:hypothetical protein DIPPA_29065 [Diplonema papillatum]
MHEPGDGPKTSNPPSGGNPGQLTAKPAPSIGALPQRGRGEDSVAAVSSDVSGPPPSAQAQALTQFSPGCAAPEAAELRRSVLGFLASQGMQKAGFLPQCYERRVKAGLDFGGEPIRLALLGTRASGVRYLLYAAAARLLDTLISKQSYPFGRSRVFLFAVDWSVVVPAPDQNGLVDVVVFFCRYTQVVADCIAAHRADVGGAANAVAGYWKKLVTNGNPPKIPETVRSLFRSPDDEPGDTSPAPDLTAWSDYSRRLRSALVEHRLPSFIRLTFLLPHVIAEAFGMPRVMLLYQQLSRLASPAGFVLHLPSATHPRRPASNPQGTSLLLSGSRVQHQFTASDDDRLLSSDASPDEDIAVSGPVALAAGVAAAQQTQSSLIVSVPDLKQMREFFGDPSTSAEDSSWTTASTDHLAAAEDVVAALPDVQLEQAREVVARSGGCPSYIYELLVASKGLATAGCARHVMSIGQSETLKQKERELAVLHGAAAAVMERVSALNKDITSLVTTLESSHLGLVRSSA